MYSRQYGTFSRLYLRDSAAPPGDTNTDNITKKYFHRDRFIPSETSIDLVSLGFTGCYSLALISDNEKVEFQIQLKDLQVATF